MSKKAMIDRVQARRRERKYMLENLIPDWWERTRGFLERLDIRDRIIIKQIKAGVRQFDVDE